MIGIKDVGIIIAFAFGWVEGKKIIKAWASRTAQERLKWLKNVKMKKNQKKVQNINRPQKYQTRHSKPGQKKRQK